MKRYINSLQSCSIAFIIGFSLIFASCEDSDDTEEIGNWVELSDFDGVPRTDAVAFTIDNKAYLGTGFEEGNTRLRDFWSYNPELNFWTRLDSFPGIARNGAVGFSVNGKGYIGLGYDGEDRLKDFWEYDPQTNSWTQIADFGGTARYGAIAFSIGDYGYVGTGYDGNYLKDFWRYSPATNKWEQIISIGGSKRIDAAVFVIDDKAYVCTGIDNGSYEEDFWVYDPITGLWTQLRDISDTSDDDYDDDYSIRGTERVAFTINGKGYLATGGVGGISNDVWEYDPITDLWEQKTYFEGSSRLDAVGFGIGDRGYVTTGQNSSYYFDDLWGFDPDDEYDEND